MDRTARLIDGMRLCAMNQTHRSEVMNPPASAQAERKRMKALEARVTVLEAALREVRAVLQSDSVEYDDMRHIDHIIDEAIAGDGDCQEHDWSWADAAGQQVCKRCGLRSPPSDGAEHEGAVKCARCGANTVPDYRLSLGSVLCVRCSENQE